MPIGAFLVFLVVLTLIFFIAPIVANYVRPVYVLIIVFALAWLFVSFGFALYALLSAFLGTAKDISKKKKIGGYYQ